MHSACSMDSNYHHDSTLSQVSATLRLLHSPGQHKSKHTGGGQWDQIWDILGKETQKLAKGLPWCSSG